MSPDDGTGGEPTLRDLACMVRSKNAGPFVVTLDLFFDAPEPCRRVLDSDLLDPGRLGRLYGVDPAGIAVRHVDHANAVKITLPRPLSAGDVGDRDVAGGQQFARLLDLPLRDPALIDPALTDPAPIVSPWEAST